MMVTVTAQTVVIRIISSEKEASICTFKFEDELGFCRSTLALTE